MPPNTSITRDRHGFRGVPRPATFDIYTLPDSAPLTDFEICSVLRVSTNTTASWRRRGLHLKWFTLPGGLVRSTAGAVKALLAMGETRTRTPTARPSNQTQGRAQIFSTPR